MTINWIKKLILKTDDSSNIFVKPLFEKIYLNDKLPASTFDITEAEKSIYGNDKFIQFGYEFYSSFKSVEGYPKINVYREDEFRKKYNKYGKRLLGVYSEYEDAIDLFDGNFYSRMHLMVHELQEREMISEEGMKKIQEYSQLEDELSQIESIEISHHIAIFAQILTVEKFERDVDYNGKLRDDLKNVLPSRYPLKFIGNYMTFKPEKYIDWVVKNYGIDY